MLAQARSVMCDKRARGMTLEDIALAIDLCVRMKSLLDSELIRLILRTSETSGLEVRSIVLSQAMMECPDAAISWARDPPTELRLQYEPRARNAVVTCDIPLLRIVREEDGFLLVNEDRHMSQLKTEQFFEVAADSLERRSP
ncbi:MAG: hypothetical protein MUE65_06080 [Methanomassiliicoccales archaeon]|jgi:hypothetical protein|nr:hypothetical protein [Methanomassiliicoccales archaeon]